MRKLRKSVPIYLLLTIAQLGLNCGIKYNYSNLNTKRANLNAEISNTKKTIEVLEAEWGYLTQPSRLEKLAAKHLKLQPIMYDQVQSNAKPSSGN